MSTEPADITSRFVDALNRKFEGRETPAGAIHFSIEDGGRYRGKYFDKIVLPHMGGSPDGSNAHAFVECQTGQLYRAASRTIPVEDVRYDLSDENEFALAVKLADPLGNYLRRNYVRRPTGGASKANLHAQIIIASNV